METGKKEMTDIRKKILTGLELVSEKLVKEAKEKQQELVVMRDKKIIKVRFSD